MQAKQTDFERMSPQQIIDLFRCHNSTVNMDLVRKNVRGMMFASERTRHLFTKNLSTLYAKEFQKEAQIDTPFLPLPEEKRSNDIFVGNFVQGDKDCGNCFLKVEELTHSFCAAGSGFGKSNLLWLISGQVVEKNSVCIVFDAKREGRHILGSIPFVVLNANDFRINIFETPVENITQRSWISKVCDLFTIFGLYYSSRNYIKEFVISLLEETGQTPTIFDLYSAMKSKVERGQTRASYHDASLNKIENLVEELGSFFNCKKSFPIKKLLDLPLVIEIDNLSQQSQRFFIAFFLLTLVELRKAEDIRGNPALDQDSIFIFIHEAATLWNAQLDFSDRTQEMSYDLLQEIPLIARDFKICLFFSSQLQLSKNVMANARTKFLSNLPDAVDSWSLGNSIGVKPEIFQKLGVGEFVVKTGKTEPFLIKTTKIERQIIDDVTLTNLKKDFVEHIMLNCTPLTNQEAVEKTETTKLDSNSKNLLINVVNCPSLTVTQRYDQLSLTGRYAQELKQSLIERKLVEEVFLAIGSSKQSTFLVPTQKAIEYLDSIVEPARFYKHIGSTSSMHKLIQAMLIEHFTEKNCTVKNDYQVGEKFVDVYVESGKTKIVFEVAVNPAIDEERVSSALTFVDQFIVLAADLMTLKSIENRLKPLSSDKIKIFLASFFIGCLKKGTLDIIPQNNTEQQNSSPKKILTSQNVEQQKNRNSQQIG